MNRIINKTKINRRNFRFVKTNIFRDILSFFKALEQKMEELKALEQKAKKECEIQETAFKDIKR